MLLNQSVVEQMNSLINFMNELDYYLVLPNRFEQTKPCFCGDANIGLNPKYLTLEECISLHNGFNLTVQTLLQHHSIYETTLHTPRKSKKIILNVEKLETAISKKSVDKINIKWSKRKQKLMENIREEI